MDEKFFPSGIAGIDRVGFDAGLRAHMQRVFNYMGAGLGLTGLVAYVVAHTALIAILASPLRWVIVFAPLAIVLFMNFKMQTASVTTLKVAFWAFCIVMGMSMASIFLIYTGQSIARVFFITAATFGSASLWGYLTKSDLTGMGAFMRMGLLGLIIAGVVNLFFASPMLAWVSSVIGVVVFTGLTAFDTQKIKENYAESWGAQSNEKLAVFGALSLYLDFINMFMYMLRIMGAVQRNN